LYVLVALLLDIININKRRKIIGIRDILIRSGEENILLEININKLGVGAREV